MINLQLKTIVREYLTMPLVTFNQNVDTHVAGDKVELNQAEIKRLEDYATRWEIKDAFSVAGGKKASEPAAPKAPKQPAGSSKVVTPPAEGQTTKQPKTTTVDTSGDTDEGKTPATELPPVTGDPATDEGSKPKVETK